MLIHLDFDHDALRSVDTSLLSSAVTELLRCHRYGHHLLVINRRLSRSLLSELTLSAADRAALERIGQEYTQSADLLRRSPLYIVVKLDAQVPMRNVGSAIEISIATISEPYLLDRVVLIVEDSESDGRMYELLLDNLRDRLKVPPLNWEIIHGGGERTASVLSDKIDDRRIVCTIIDSDRSAPSHDPVVKSSRLKRIAAEQSWPLSIVATLPCREIENLIPLDVVRYIPTAVQRSDTVQNLILIETAEARGGVDHRERFWLHFDVKEGLSNETLQRLASEGDRNWIHEKLQLIGINPMSFRIEGFGTRVVPQVLDDNQLCAAFRRSVRTNQWWDVFGDCFAELMWACVAARRQFA